MSDRYRTFAELAAHEREGRDYRRWVVKRNSEIVVIAPHGGDIEPGTSETARALAGDTFSLYCFGGLRSQGNARLHITSTHFDEPVGVELVEQSRLAVAVHGAAEARPVAYIGGRNSVLKEGIITSLTKAGFPAREDRTNHSGVTPGNICNRCSSGLGLQLELTRGLRQQLFTGLNQRERRHGTPCFIEFIRAIREVVARIGYDNICVTDGHKPMELASRSGCYCNDRKRKAGRLTGPPSFYLAFHNGD